MWQYIKSAGKGKVELANREPPVAATKQITKMKDVNICVFPYGHVESLNGPFGYALSRP